MQTYYLRLATDEQRAAYDAIKRALEQKAPYANVRCETGYDKVYEAVLLDNPLCCLSHPWMQCNYDGRSYSLQYIQIQEAEFFAKLDELENHIREVCANSGVTGAYDTYKTIYDVLSDRIEYASGVYEDYERLMSRNPSHAELSRFLQRNGNAFSPYGALVGKKAVCNGIAKLFQIVCDRFGLPCACVQASSTRYYKRPPDELPDNEQCDHLLNVIEIDGQQAFADLTNGLVSKDQPFTAYDLFAVNYNVLKKSYLLRASDLLTFTCNGVDNMYFTKNKLVFPTLGAFRRYLRNYISKFRRGEIRAYYSGGKISDNDLADIFEDIVISHCPPTKEISGVRCSNGFASTAIIDRS